MHSWWRLRELISGRGFPSLLALNQNKLHCWVFTLFRVSNRRELHAPVTWCLGKNNFYYLLVLMLLAGKCYYTTAKKIPKAQNSRAIYVKVFWTKKKKIKAHSQARIISCKKTDQGMIWHRAVRNECTVVKIICSACNSNWKRSTNSYLIQI